MIFIALTALLLAIALPVRSAFRRRRQSVRLTAVSHREPASLVRVLADDEELGVAVRRAARFEQVAEQGLVKRQRHYATLLRRRSSTTKGTGRVVAFEARPTGGGEAPHETAS